MINLQLEIFLLILTGFVLSKIGLFSQQTRKQLTSIVLSVVLPCATIQSFEIEVSSQLLISVVTVLLISTGIQFVYYFFCKTCWNKAEPKKKINLQYGTMVSNAGFMGMPVAQSVFGSLGLLYASVFLIPQRICMWSYGLSLYAKGEKINVVKKVATHPCLVGLYIGVVLMILGMYDIHLPKFLDSTISAVGSCNTALSMFVIGGILSDVPKEDVLDKISFLYSALRLIVLPLLILFILHFFEIDTLARNVCVLLSAMPAAGTTAMLAQNYDADPQFASKLIFVSTLLSMLTLPLILFILQHV